MVSLGRSKGLKSERNEEEILGCWQWSPSWPGWWWLCRSLCYNYLLNCMCLLRNIFFEVWGEECSKPCSCGLYFSWVKCEWLHYRVWLLSLFHSLKQWSPRFQVGDLVAPQRLLREVTSWNQRSHSASGARVIEISAVLDSLISG